MQKINNLTLLFSAKKFEKRLIFVHDKMKTKYEVSCVPHKKHFLAKEKNMLHPKIKWSVPYVSLCIALDYLA